MVHLRLRSPRRFGIVSVLLVLTAVAVSALPEIPEPGPGSNLLEEATTLTYSQRGTDREIFQLLDDAEAATERIDDRRLARYWQARIHLARATRYNQNGEDRAAQRAAEDGFTLIRDVLAGGTFSEGLRVLADLHSQMMIAKGLFYMIRNGEEARDAALEALERAPRSIKAQITVAGFLLNAPPMAGGDTEQARLVLERALAQEPASENDRFLILGWLAQASHTLDDVDAAERYFAEAFAIYPDSEWLAEIGEEISE